MKKIEVLHLNPSQLKHEFGNPRKITETKKKELKKSLEKYGDHDLIKIDESHNIISGNQRVKAMIELGIDTPILCKKLIGYSEKELKAINIKSNEHYGEWDYDLLNEWMDELKDFDKELDIKHELDKEEIEDDMPEVKDTTVKLGDLYRLGRHYLLCGDSTKEESYKYLLKDNKIDMVFTDPPYGVSYADKNKFLNNQDEGNRIQVEIKNDHLDLEGCKKLWYETFKNIKDYLDDYSSYFVCSPQGGDLYLMMMMMMNDSGLKLRHNIIWNKNNHVLGRTDYNYKHEPIIYGWVNRHKYYGKGSQKFSVWNFNKPHKSDLHPTMKPVELIENAILNNSKGDDLIFDAFLGSGSTLIACEKTKRRCYGIKSFKRL